MDDYQSDAPKPLDEDNDTPFSLPDDIHDKPVVDPTHPTTDSGLDSHELYDEDLEGASESDTTPPDNNVTGYKPERSE